MLVSVIVRAKNEEDGIGRVLELLAAQRLDPGQELELIVVDSGSTDGTVEIARRHGARVVEIAPERFTFGNALNIGAAAARGELHIALSAHAFPRHDRFVADMVAHLRDPRVSCVSTGLRAPDGRLLDGPVRGDRETLERTPRWGYSNGEGAYRAELWRAYPWRWDMPGTEDKEWAHYWARRAGYEVVVDPSLHTDHSHPEEVVRGSYERFRREWVGLAMYLPVERMTVGELARRLWSEQGTWPSLWRARRSPKRAARLVGEFVGRRHRATSRAEIALMTDQFPELSETFIATEAAALARLGHGVAVESLAHAPHPADAAPAGVPVRFACDETRAERRRALAWLLLRHPRAVLADRRDRARWAAEEPVPGLLSLAVRARRLARRRGVHLHAHFAAGAALDALRISRLIGTPFSVAGHGYDVFLRPRNLREKLMESAFAVGPSDHTVAHLRGVVGEAHAGRILKVVMGVDGERFRRGAPHPGGRHVVAVGRLVEKKGFVHLVRAAARLEDVRVTIAGEGPLRGELEAEIARLGAGDRVALAGPLQPPAVRTLLEDADLLAMPCVVAADGDRDAMPVVVKEALAMEVCVVGSDEVGLPEVLRAPWGELVPPGDDAALAAAIERMLARPVDERAAAGRAGRAFVLERFDAAEEAAKLATFARAGRVP